MARTHDMDRAHMQETFRRAHEHNGAAFVEVLQNCNVFNDGAFEKITGKEVRSNMLIPLRARRAHRLRRRGRRSAAWPSAPTAASRSSTWARPARPACLVHDEKRDDPGLAFALSRLARGPYEPTPIGVFRAVERPEYGTQMSEQIVAGPGEAGPGRHRRPAALGLQLDGQLKDLPPWWQSRCSLFADFIGHHGWRDRRYHTRACGLLRSSRQGLRRVIPLTIVGVMSLAAAGAAVVAVVGTSPSADAAVASAVTSTLNDRTADVTLSGSAGISQLTIPITGSGAIDFSQNDLQLQLGIPVPGGAQSVAEKIIYVDKTIYVNVAGIATRLLPGKSWISMDASQVSGNSALTPATRAGRRRVAHQPGGPLKLLSQGGGQATDLGPSTVNGQSVEGYSVAIDGRGATAGDAATKLPALPSLPSSLHLGSSLIGGDSHIGYQVFITKATGRLARMVTSISLTIIGETISDDMTMDFTNLGAPVDISAPPASEIIPYQQYLQLAKSGSGSAV